MVAAVKESLVETGLMLLYSALLGLVLVAGSPYWLLRMLGSGRYRAGLAGRLGVVPGDLREAVRGREVVWLHAVSVGEVMAAVALVRGLQAARPGMVVVVSTTTKTGQELAKKRLAGMPVFYLPLDFRYAVRRYLGVLRPRMLVLMESELWPNLLRECGRAGILVAVVNARVSDRSYPRYMRLRRLWRPLLERVTVFLAQGGETAERLRAMGVDAGRVRVVGNLKFDVKVAGSGAMVERLRLLMPEGARVVVCGSTLEGEEAMLLGAWPGVLEVEPRAVMVLAPRHPERFGRVVEMVRGAGLRVWRASELGDRESFGADKPTSQNRDVGHPASEPTLSGGETAGEDGAPAFDGSEMGEGPHRFAAGDVVVLDTIGDLPGGSARGAVAFVGGSLVPAGGHNPLEPAQFGVPVVIGSNFNNFREIVEMMRAMDGVRVVTAEGMPDGLRDVLRGLLCDRAEAWALGERGRAVFRAEAGATGRTVEALLGGLGGGGAESSRSGFEG